MKRYSAILVIFVAAWLPGLAHAEERLPFKATPAELAALPPYCVARLAGDPEVQAPWQQQMGKELFLHLHHFCNGLNYVNRLRLRPTSKHRLHYYQTAIAQFNYVLHRWPQDFELTAEARNHKAQLEMQLKLMNSKRR